MKNERKKKLIAACILLALFALWTIAVCRVDVQPIGAEGTNVGFARLNGRFHALTGVHMTLYTLTDWLGMASFVFVLGFGLLGLVQLIRRGHLCRVDRSILALGIFYILVLAAYFLFEKLAINYRPILIDGRLEASYPSSTTMLALCVLPTAMMQLKRRIRSRTGRALALWLLGTLTAFLVAARLISGVHWLTDIIGGALLSAGLVLLYAAFSE